MALDFYKNWRHKILRRELIKNIIWWIFALITASALYVWLAWNIRPLF